ncbi:MAG: LOG family protein [Gammaproteobacteria bacterium]|nr:LOG family protein [Gammaproteobacteria bacterium]NIR84970.1 LOG family protein [Gammaproteobacteria bacterium]NIR91819.1 LOG family protein [Gammaproteobacteria bacterium]NIU06017.1 LOG family protein [Gammaproteobacteria bacterium]NIV53064.1 lysine decarboxylase [Gammaproteobacteria bacterium]
MRRTFDKPDVHDGAKRDHTVRADERPAPADKAYKNTVFLDSRDARPLRILAEYLEPAARFERLHVKDTIVFFGSSRIRSREAAAAELEAARGGHGDPKAGDIGYQMSAYYESARELAHRLSEWSRGLEDPDRRFIVCTGGGPGIMEAASRGARDAQALNVGLTISIPITEFENPYVTEQLSFEFHYFFMRKFWFTYLAKAVVVMPGGFGTLDELFELMTLIQTLKMKKRLPVVLFGTGFWDEVINFDALARYGLIDKEDLDLFFRTDSVDEAYDYITSALADSTVSDNGPSL